MKKNKNKSKGITLISLVITIIILLILAGISIIVLAGDNGLIAKAKQAKNNTIDSKEQENSALVSYEGILDGSREMENSSIIEKIDIEVETFATKINVNITPTIKEGFTEDDVSTYLYVFNGEIKSATKDKTLKITGLTKNTNFSIYVLGIDKYVGMKKTEKIESKTKENIEPVYVYNRGNTYNEITGGWIISKQQNAICELNSTNMHLSGPGLSYCTSLCYTKNYFDFKNYSTIQYKVKLVEKHSDSYPAKLGYGTSLLDCYSTLTGVVPILDETQERTYTVDISSVNTNQQIGIHGGISEMYVYEVALME